MGNTNNKIIAALLTGAAIGAAVGILMAPDKGSDTRKKIKAKGSELTDAMKAKVEELLEEFRIDAGEIKEKASALMTNGKSAVDKINLS